jgi:hypothetical protein
MMFPARHKRRQLALQAKKPPVSFSNGRIGDQPPKTRIATSNARLNERVGLISTFQHCGVDRSLQGGFTVPKKNL